jgi:hypothetical protein
MPIAPAALITGAPRLALPFGLLSTFTIRQSGRFEAGVQFETITCDPAGGIGPWGCNAQTATQGGTGLTAFTLTYSGQTTGSIAAAATGATVETALIALSNVGPNDVEVTGGAGGPYLVTFTGSLADTAVLLTATPTGGSGTMTVSSGPGGLGLPKTLTSNAGTVGVASPFTIYGHFTCSPVGYPDNRAQDLATAHLLSREEARAEQAFWTGDLGNLPSLQDAATTDVTPTPGTAVSLATGLGLLENKIATTYGSLGVIHMTRGAAEIGLGAYLLDISGGRLMTRIGTPVAAGAGYPGTSPTGTTPAAGATWLYASPAVFGYRSEVFTSSSQHGDLFDRAQNNLYAIAERTYVLGFDPCGVAAVLVTTA